MVLATTRLLLCHSCLPQVGCGIIKNGSNLAWTPLVSGLSSNSKCLFHELVQTLDGMIELARCLSEFVHVEISRVRRSMPPAISML
jgi:hypothetical protein